MARLNFSSGLFRGNIENKRFQSFLKEEGYLNLFLNESASFGIVKKQSDSSLANFKVEAGTNSGTVKIGINSEAIDSNGNLIKQEARDNIAIPVINTWYWVKVTYLESTLEEGTISISTNGTITGIGTSFTQRLRGGKYTASKIKLQSSLNTLEYQVVEVIDDTNILISGEQFAAESGIKYSVVGTFTPDSVPTQAEKFPFRYDSCALEFVAESTLNTPPTKGTNEYFLSRVRNNSGSVILEDKRTEFYRSKSENILETIDIESNPLIGIEAIKWQDAQAPRDKNLVEVAWGLRSSNYTANSSLNQISVIGGLGGKFKTTSDFTDGDFNGWRIYFSNGKYAKVVSSNLVASQINLVLDNFDISNISGNGEILIVPNVEAVVIRLFANGNTTLKTQEFEFPINQRIAIIEATCYDSPTSAYTLSYRYKKFNIYSEYETFPSDSVGYYNETSFQANGELNPEPADRTRLASVDGSFLVSLASNSFFNRIQSISTGDLFGVRRFELDNTNPVINFEVGTDFQTQLLESQTQTTLTVDNYFNIRTANANNGNSFEFIFEADLLLNGNDFIITQDYVNTGDIGIVLFTFNDFYVKQSRDKNLRVKLVFDGANWVVNDIVSVSPTNIITKTFPIGIWNMDTTNSVLIDIEITRDRIVSFDLLIYSDNGSPLLRGGLSSDSTAFSDISLEQFNSAVNEIRLVRLIGGFYDSIAFSNSSINRGYITINYLF